MWQRGPYTILPPKDEVKTNVQIRDSVKAVEIPGRRDVAARALHNTSTKRRKKVKKANVQIRDPVQAVEM